MGSCIADNPRQGRSKEIRKPNPHNPISQIIESEGTEELEDRWKRHQFKVVKNKMKSLQDNMKFPEFQNLFPKIKDFSQPTQVKIYQLFGYESRDQLTKKELFKALTLVRKIDKHDDFARFIFYIYSEDPKHQVMSQRELQMFKSENEVHLKPETIDEELQEHFSENEEPKLQNLASKLARSGNPLENKMFKTNGASLQEQKWTTLADFQKIFKDYNILSYQVMFDWNQEEEEQELITIIQKQGIVRKKGDKVYILDFKWWLQWTNYVQYKYHKKIEITKDEQIQNYNSTKVNRKYSTSKLIEPKIDTPIPQPAEIKNQSLLTKSKERGTELLPNLVEEDNIICVPEKIWNKLVLIYHGGPPIERTYPEIYRRFVLQAEVNEDGKFVPKKLKKMINREGGHIQNLLIERSKASEPYYKHPGELNWKRLGKDPKIIQEVFNYQRTFLAMVPRSQQKTFIENYNVQEKKEGNYLKKRFKNYGTEINISVEGVLTRAEVTEIISHDQIKVIYQNQEGSTETNILKIDENLELLNPENLDRGRQINELPGLSNLGNTCYMNAVLQCLIRTPYFGKYLHQDFFDVKPTEKRKDELLLQQIARLYNDSKSSRQETVSTLNFKRTFDKVCPFFQGNLQHDAQQFLICLLERISQEIKTKKKQSNPGLNKSQQQSSSSEAVVNKKIVKFFSGKTQAITSCLKCHNKNKREEPFFTFSLSLPEMKETEYFYFYVEDPKKAKFMIPVRYGITLGRKATVEDLINGISKTHKRDKNQLAIYTVFNNEILSLLEPRTWYSEIAHYLSFNVKLVCYEIEYMYSPTYYSYREKKLTEKSVKIELRQRRYSRKTEDYRIVYLPFVLEVTCETKWDDLIDQVHTIIGKLSIEEPLSVNSTPILENKEIKVSTSGLRQNEAQANKISTIRPKDISVSLEKEAKPYKIRVIKTDQYYQNYCVFCKDEFVLTRRSRGTRTCKGQRCTFNKEKILFEDQQFRNINDLIIIAVDWIEDMPHSIPLFFSHDSYEQALKKSESRKDYLEELINSNFRTAEKLELRCEKKECGHQWVERIEKISVSPNILLLHLKRFRYEDNRLVKLTNNVQYPEKLTLPGTKDEYQLFGVAVHLGSGVGGHYISYVKVSKKWYICDDTKVSLAEPKQHIDNNAYLLFYYKTDFQPSLVSLSF